LELILKSKAGAASFLLFKDDSGIAYYTNTPSQTTTNCLTKDWNYHQQQKQTTFIVSETLGLKQKVKDCSWNIPKEQSFDAKPYPNFS
jgi:capsule polysaccharide export protein KpsC/LpsZ